MQSSLYNYGLSRLCHVSQLGPVFQEEHATYRWRISLVSSLKGIASQKTSYLLLCKAGENKIEADLSRSNVFP